MTHTPCLWKLKAAMLLPDVDLPHPLSFHEGAFCNRVKSCPGGNDRCMNNDAQEIGAQIERRQHPFVMECQAGAFEVIVPIRSLDELPGKAGIRKCLGALIIGPFRLAGTRCHVPEAEEEYQRLPELTPDRRLAFLAFTAPLFESVIRDAYAEPAGLLPRLPHDDRIRRLLAELRLHPQLSVDEAAALIFLSRSRLLHLFKAECGINFASYGRKLRLREARRYLLGGDWPISQIAAATGFSDQSHFTRLFRSEYGMTPLACRKSWGRSGA